MIFQATDRLYRTTDRVFEVVACRQCGLARLAPWPSPSELIHYYPQEYWYSPEREPGGELVEAYRRFVLRDHVRFVERALKSCGETGLVLDVGCGGGLFLGQLQARGWTVAGLDFSCDAAQVAWRRNGVPAVCASLTRAPFPAESCAALTMFHVLEHLYDPASFLDAARGLLKPEGRLIVQVPNASCWQSVWLGEHWSGIDAPRHLIHFRARDLEQLLVHTGFEPLRFKHFSLRDNPAGLATSLAPGLDPMARRIRRLPESPAGRLIRDLVYLALVAACVPLTLIEASCRAGSTLMVEARKRA